ncbi:MAG: type II toxin-antitoxin system RelE/ParE family toxin [Bacteroidota bacterium]
MQPSDNYFNMLLDRCQDIADNPKLGRNYDGIKPDLLGLKTSRHIIFYRNSKNKPVEITRILHEQMDLENRLDKK